MNSIEMFSSLFGITISKKLTSGFFNFQLVPDTLNFKLQFNFYHRQFLSCGYRRHVHIVIVKGIKLLIDLVLCCEPAKLEQIHQVFS